MLIKPFRYQISVGDWVAYNDTLYDWLLGVYPSMPEYQKEHYAIETSKKYRVYDIGIFKRSGLIQLQLQESCHQGTDLNFRHMLNPDGTSAEHAFNQFPGQFVVKVSK